MKWKPEACSYYGLGMFSSYVNYLISICHKTFWIFNRVAVLLQIIVIPRPTLEFPTELLFYYNARNPQPPVECKRYWSITLSHLSTHLAWNSWLQGRTRSSWRFSKSHMHTTHDVWSRSERRLSLLKQYAGSCLMSALVSPRGFASPRRSARFSRACK